jgi:hypothetical protein
VCLLALGRFDSLGFVTGTGRPYLIARASPLRLRAGSPVLERRASLELSGFHEGAHLACIHCVRFRNIAARHGLARARGVAAGKGRGRVVSRGRRRLWRVLPGVHRGLQGTNPSGQRNVRGRRRQPKMRLGARVRRPGRVCRSRRVRVLRLGRRTQARLANSHGTCGLRLGHRQLVFCRWRGG